MKGYTCDGQMSIFDILGQEPAKPKQQGYDYSNPILNHMLEELKEIFTVTEIKYEVWDHVPNLGKRMNATLKDLPDVWDITEMMDRYLKDYELELSTTIWDQLSGEKEIWLSTMWTTKGHKERTDWKEETEKPQVAAVKYECGEWVKEHGQRVLFEDIETDKYYIHDYSTVSHESFKVVYTKRKTEDAIMYVDSPRGIKAEWSWGNTFSALSRKEWVDGEECHCGWFYEMPTEENMAAVQEKPIRQPCGRPCDVEWCSKECFLKRGRVWNTKDGGWVRNSQGEALKCKNRECDWEPDE